MSGFLALQGMPLLACLVMLSVLGYLGIHVLKREVIFIDIALAQVAAVGAIAAHVLFHVHGDSLVAQIFALGTTLLAAAFFAVARQRVRRIPLEAIIGVSYAMAAAGALFLVGINPGGHTHIQSMLAGSILWATPGQVLVSAAILAVVGLCFFLFRERFHVLSEDYQSVAAAGGTVAWDFFFYALVGIVITTVVRMGGVVVVFSFLIMPAALSALLAEGWPARLAVTWLGGAGAAIVGLLFADRFDFSVGPAISLWLGVALVLAGLLRRLGTGRRSAGLALTVAGLALAVGFGGGHPDQASGQVDRPDVPVARTTAGDEQEVADPQEQIQAVVLLLEHDYTTGLDRALDLLAGDIPLYYRLELVEKLDEAGGVAAGYDINREFSSPGNRAAVQVWRSAASR